MVAFRYALTLAKLFDADLTLLHVFEESYSFDEEIGLGAVELLGVKKSNAEHELSFVEEHLRTQRPKCRSCFRVGTAFEQIVLEAESIGADLIVMSSHCYSWLDRILHGSDAVQFDLRFVGDLRGCITYKPWEEATRFFPS
jgi:nucleotide-binding universal stress UspA family protein